MTTIETIKLANKLLSNHSELNGWNFSFNNRKNSFGLCSYSKRNISLSRYFIDSMTDKAIHDTLIHEIAHALTPGHGHDYTWYKKCIELGGDGQRVSGYDKFNGGKSTGEEINSKISKYTLTCPVCGNKNYFNRKPKNDYCCSKHGGKYDPMYKLVITQNY